MTAKLRVLSVYQLQASKPAMAELCIKYLSPELVADVQSHIGEFGLRGAGAMVMVDLHSAIQTKGLPLQVYQLYAQALAERFDWLWLVE